MMPALADAGEFWSRRLHLVGPSGTIMAERVGDDARPLA